MSWQIALMAASFAMDAMSAKAAANAQETAALFDKAQLDEQADLAKIQAQQQEVQRRRDLDELTAINNNAMGYDPYSSPSFLAMKKEDKRRMEDDVMNIQLMGRSQVRRFELGSQAAGIEAKSARRAGNMAVLKAAVGAGKSYAKYKGGGGNTGVTNSGPGGEFFPGGA